MITRLPPWWVPCESAPDDWFDGGVSAEAAAKRACAGCYFRPDCLSQAMAWEWGTPAAFRFGIWAGLNGAERFVLELAQRRESLPPEPEAA